MSNKVLSTQKITYTAFAPGVTTATNVGFVDMADYGCLVASYYKTVGSTAVTAISVVASADSSGTDAVTVATLSLDSNPDAVGDYVFVEVAAEEVQQAGAEADPAQTDLRYVSLQVTAGDAGEEALVGYILAEPRYAENGLTSDVVA